MKKIKIVASSFMILAGILMVLYSFSGAKIIGVLASVCFIIFGFLLVLVSKKK